MLAQRLEAVVRRFKDEDIRRVALFASLGPSPFATDAALRSVNMGIADADVRLERMLETLESFTSRCVVYDTDRCPVGGFQNADTPYTLTATRSAFAVAL